jgi:hypothetical protein
MAEKNHENTLVEIAVCRSRDCDWTPKYKFRELPYTKMFVLNFMISIALFFAPLLKLMGDKHTYRLLVREMKLWLDWWCVIKEINNSRFVRFEVFTAVTMKKASLLSTDFPCSPSPFSSFSYRATLRMEAIRSSETSVNRISTRVTSQKTGFFNLRFVYISC